MKAAKTSESGRPLIKLNGGGMPIRKPMVWERMG